MDHIGMLTSLTCLFVCFIGAIFGTPCKKHLKRLRGNVQRPDSVLLCFRNAIFRICWEYCLEFNIYNVSNLEFSRKHRLARKQWFLCRHFLFPRGRDEPPVLHCSLLVGVGPNVGCYRHCCRYLNLSTDMFLDISDMFSTQQHNMPNQFNHTSQIIYLENVVWSAFRVFQQAQFKNTITWIIRLVCWWI